MPAEPPDTFQTPLMMSQRSKGSFCRDFVFFCKAMTSSAFGSKVVQTRIHWVKVDVPDSEEPVMGFHQTVERIQLPSAMKAFIKGDELNQAEPHSCPAARHGPVLDNTGSRGFMLLSLNTKCLPRRNHTILLKGTDYQISHDPVPFFE